MTNLTDKWRKGELNRNKIYYYETPFNTTDTASGYWLCNHLDTEKDKVEILGEVPTYDEYQKLLSDQLAKNEGVEINAELEAENTKLKKWCEEFNALEVAKENTKLKEELKEICEKYLKIKTTVSAYEEACKDLHAYIKKLKELLKRVNEHFKWVDFDDNNYVEYELWEDIKKVLGEE